MVEKSLLSLCLTDFVCRDCHCFVYVDLKSYLRIGK